MTPKATPALFSALLLMGSVAVGQMQSVTETLHNLSVTGPGEIRSLTETEVCKFCHVPHNAELPTPLWGHALSTARYQMPEIPQKGGANLILPQPDGSSRLCLSCHDGTVALGDVAGEAQPILMQGGSRIGPERQGFIGTDLSGSHPISFVISDSLASSLPDDSDMELRPLASIRAEPDVKLDAEDKMQCTTCHDPHSDSYYRSGVVPHFWVRPSVEEVCLTCHELR